MTNTPETSPEPKAKPKRTATIAKIAGLTVAFLVTLLLLAIWGLDSGAGKGFLLDRVNNLKFDNGLKISVGRIEGSLYNRAVIRDIKLSDPKGVFAQSPAVTLDWRPFAYLNKHVDVRELSSERIDILRRPELTPTPKTASEPFKLPDLKVDIGKLSVERLNLAQGVAGDAQTLTLSGDAHVKKGQILVNTAASSTRADRLALKIDATPKENRLIVEGLLIAPKDGAVVALIGLDEALTVTAGGRGNWDVWDGRIEGHLGDNGLADVALTGRDGTFTAKGSVRPDLLLSGVTAALVTPAINIDLTAKFKDRRADGQLTLKSDALDIKAAGIIDLKNARFGKLNIDAELTKAAVIDKNLSGKNVHLKALIDGDFKRPLIDYDLSADWVKFNKITVEAAKIEGRSRIDGDHIIIPVKGGARRVWGVNAAADGLLTNVRLDGDLAYSDNRLLSDNMKIRSDKLNGTALLVADFGTGIYQGALKGRINDYRIEGLGIVSVVTDAKLVQRPVVNGQGGGFGLKGSFQVQSKRLFNEGLQSFLGGNAKISGAFSTATNGEMILNSFKGTSPSFNMTAQGRYALKGGGIILKAQATSKQYGPLTANVSGTASSPKVVLTAASPGLGLELRDVVATLTTSKAGYEVKAEGASAYGPLLADVDIRSGEGPLTLDINQARVAGIDAQGTIQQTSGGKFAGDLNLSGSGVTGVASLMEINDVQGAKITARANGTTLPGDYNIQVGRALIDATIALYEKPEIIADVQAQNLNYNATFVEKGRVKINYRNDRGTAQAVLNGSSGVPFTLAVNASLSPQLYRIAANGVVNGINVKTEAPARIVKRGTGYQLLPSTLSTNQGKVQLAGQFDDAIKAQARFEGFDLAIINAIAPDAGIGGTATGSVDYSQNGIDIPDVRARLTIDDFTRSSIAAVSSPVDINIDGTLNSDRGDLRAVFRQNGANLLGGVIGRMQVQLDPASGSDWIERLRQGGITGGIRYNGPASVLFSLAAQGDQSMSGTIAVAADISGQVRDPRLSGVMRGNGLAYEHSGFGTRITRITLDGQFSNDRLEIRKFDGRAGDGTVSATGWVSLAADNAFPLQLNAKLNNARLAASDQISSTVSGTLDITNGDDGALIKGNLSLPQTRYKIVTQGAAEITELEGVRRPAITTAGPPPRQKAPPKEWRLDVRVRADNQIFVSGMGLESEWRANINVGGTTRAPRVLGNLNAIRGTYNFAGREFKLDTGVISFEGGQLTNPEIEITASTVVDDITGTINVTGTAQRPSIAFSSDPSLPQDEVLSRILFGESVTNLSATQALQLAASLNQLSSGGGGVNPLGTLRAATGIDRLRVLGEDDATGRGTAVAAGKYLTNNVYVEIVTDTKGFMATQLEISLSRSLSILSQTGTAGGTAVNLRYSRDY
ncbi:translocation/assembly module TamB domain-containing protein [Asticcacaulis sp. ZE23SCel15]|uniref:translocation/assembly module TamB domain-containing protein n=1 Tax=Asticcacaulis sp. ZE23SCel15 TaxID=3059027 RepID=UPI00265F4EAC|nr:translocation/assembly module TamB domain-containing protein [Asticcacaulis sp. ZE23SCel15]WKL56235.1 translocation/assembly module TamB domain-containing protein [Asticcacaulis sp. ZE23SCel15]